MNDVIRVIIADDHTLFAELLKQALTEGSTTYNFDVVGIAASGSEALQLVKNNKPRFVFLDAYILEKDDFAILKEIKARDKEVKVIAMLPHEYDEYIKHVMKHGCDGYILKDDAISQFDTMVWRFLN